MSMLLALALAAACTAQDGAASDAVPARTGCAPVRDAWRNVATEGDRDRLRNWHDAWEEALAQARAAGHGAEIAAEGALLQPDAALAGPRPPAGDYACRTLKLGSPQADLLAFVSYPAFRCRIAQQGDRLRLLKVTGSQRPNGRLFPDTERRLVFLGTMQLGDERRHQEYGSDEERNMIGLVERIGDDRWRLVIPYPRYESLLDVIELVPLAPGSRGPADP